MVEIIRIHEPGELIALVPRILGFEPRESVVVLGMNPQGRVVMSARLDRVDCRFQDVAAALAEATGTEALRTGCVGVVVLEYTEEPVPWGTEAAEALVRHWDGWVDVRDVWIVQGGTYWSPGCDDPSCCPPGGRPVPGLIPACSSHASGVRGRADGSPYAPANADDRRRARRARARFVARRSRDEPAWRREALGEWRGVLNATEVPVPCLGRLGAALAVPEVRDAVILAAISAPESEIDSVLEGRPASSLTGLEGLMHGDTRPEARVVDQFCARLLAVAAVSRAPERAAALAVLSLVLWWKGDSRDAARTAEESLRSDPEHRLASLMHQTATRGILPGWLRDS